MKPTSTLRNARLFGRRSRSTARPFSQYRPLVGVSSMREDRQERRLAAARRTGHRDVLAAADVDADVDEGPGFFVGARSPLNVLPDVFEPNERQVGPRRSVVTSGCERRFHQAMGQSLARASGGRQNDVTKRRER